MISMFRCTARGLTSATLLALMIAATSAQAATATNTVVAPSANPVVSGRAVTFTAAVAPAVSSLSAPTGTVTFTIDGAARPPVTLSRGLAKLTVDTIAVGDHQVTATYSGDAQFLGSRSGTLSLSSTAAWTAPFQPRGLDVTRNGLVGDGVTDNASALQALINRSPNGTLFYFPRGTYLVSRTIDFAPLEDVGLIGDTNAQGRPASRIKTNTPNIRLISADYGNRLGNLKIRNMDISAHVNGGTGIYTFNTVNATIENSTLSGHIGAQLSSTFVTTLRSVYFKGPGGTSGNHVGLMMSTTTSLVEGCQFTGWAEGLRAMGAGLSVIRSSFNRNMIGMKLGAREDGAPWPLSRSSINDSSFWDNDWSIHPLWISTTAFTNLRVLGTNAAPSGQSRVGIGGNGGASTYSRLQVSGVFSRAAWDIWPDTRWTHFYANSVANAAPGGQAWIVPAGQTGVQISSAPLEHAIASVDDVPADKIAIGTQASNIDVTTRGLVGNGTTDNTAALRALIATAPAGTTFYFPRGVYRVSDTLDFSRLSSFHLMGDLTTNGGHAGGTVIRGDFARPLIKADYGSGAGTFRISNVELNSSPASGGVALFAKNAVLSSLRHVRATGGTGVHLVNPAYVSIRSLDTYGSGRETGIMVDGGIGVTIESLGATALQEGLRATGRNLSVYASRFEVNRIGMSLGVNPAGNPSPLSYASVMGLHMEANDVAIRAVNCANCAFAGVSAQGSTGSPSGLSRVGLDIGASRNSVVYASEFNGDYSNPPIAVSGQASNWLFVNSAPCRQFGAAGSANIVGRDCFY